MTKVEMLAKLKSHKGVGVQVETELGNEVYYFYQIWQIPKELTEQ